MTKEVLCWLCIHIKVPWPLRCIIQYILLYTCNTIDDDVLPDGVVELEIAGSTTLLDDTSKIIIGTVSGLHDKD